MTPTIVPVRVGGGYEVHIGTGLLDRAGALLLSRRGPCRVLLVTDGNVGPLYGEKVRESLENAGFSVEIYEMPPGEAHKNPETLLRLWDAMGRAEITRSDLVFALGGGVVGDTAGFAAATWLRGVPIVQAPTSLLSMVDSSVGGKTGIDLPGGKNLAGAFHQPELVICDTDALATLPPAEYRDGMAEVIKYAVLRGEDVLREDMVERCVRIKAELVERDEHDTGERMLLNFGHTVGHAIEKVSGYTVTHGCAVSMGMAVMTRWAVKAGKCPPETYETLYRLLRQYDLPVRCDYDPEALSRAAMGDKKRSADGITVLVPHSMGDVRREKITVEEIRAMIAENVGF